MRGAKRIYMLAGIISAVLYVAGVGTGYYLQRDVEDVFGKEVESVRADITQVEQELPLLSLRGQSSCKILSTLSSDMSERLSSILGTIVDLESRGVTDDTYNELLADYTSLAVRGWILDRDIRQSCAEHSVPVLYFYSVPCEDCIEQGRILDELKDEYSGRLSVFSLNTDIDQPAVSILKKSFNITKTPSIIIDSETFAGKISKDALGNIVCTKIREC